jgi:hypothetical protein
VSSTSDLCCALHEWLVSPLRGSTEFYADAAFSTLRAHAAGKPNSRNGLVSAIRSVAAFQFDGRNINSKDGPKPTLVLKPDAALQLPQSGHSQHL